MRDKKIKISEEMLKVSATIMTIIISICGVRLGEKEYQLKSNEVRLSQLELEKEERAKQPFFSIDQDYDENKQKYIYYVHNTGGEVRYSNLNVTPLLHILQYSEAGKIVNQEFITLMGFYQYETKTKDQLFAFSDKCLDITLIDEVAIKNNNSSVVLGNDCLMNMCGKYNSLDKQGYVMGSIIYRIGISYYDYKNDKQFERIWCGRSGDFSGISNGNNILFIQPELENVYYNMLPENNANINSLNLTAEDTVKECDRCIDELFKEWNWTE